MLLPWAFQGCYSIEWQLFQQHPSALQQWAPQSLTLKNRTYSFWDYKTAGEKLKPTSDSKAEQADKATYMSAPL